MKYVMFYESAPGAPESGRHLVPAHQERIKEYAARGDLLLIGPLEDPGTNGALAVFGTREAAEEFAKGDPFVTGGVVRSWRVLEWHEALQP
ncbi:MAG TPA: YciI family protein [Amycolatopsis sp.]|nr:YciI family protein [Amycolatopsis sp.]